MKPRWVLPVVLLAMIFTACAGLVAKTIYAEPDGGTPSALAPTRSAVAPSQQPGDPTVRATPDAAAHPLYPTIRQLLQTHFDAINARDYDLWRTAVVAERAKKYSETMWRNDYSTTRDGSILVHRIESGPAGTARVLLSFTSVQEPEYAPPELPAGCIRWRLVWPFVTEDGAWKLDAGLTGSAPQHDEC